MSALAPRMSTQQALALPLPAASNTVVINARCSLRIAADQRVIVVAGLPVHHYRAEDAVAEAYAMVFLVEFGLRPANGRGAGVCPIGAHFLSQVVIQEIEDAHSRMQVT